MALQRQIVNVPFGAGVSTKPDALVLEAPKLTTAQNVRFTEIGGLQKRNPFAHMHTRIQGGGTLSDIRKIDVYNDELLCFTKDKVYSWSEGLSLWVERDTHLAVGITEQPVLTSNAEQGPQDRAEVNGIAFYVWIEDNVKAAAIDVATGAFVYGPTTWPGDGADSTAVRVVPLAETVAVVLGNAGGDLSAAIVNLDDIATTAAATFLVNSGSDYNGFFDVAAIDGQDEAYIVWDRTTATSYGLARINSSGFVSRQAEGRNCDGPISIAGFYTGSAVRLGVVRVDGTNIDGDLFSGMTSGSVNLAVGTIDSSDDQLTCEWRNAAESDGSYRCYAFWSADEVETSSDFETKFNYMDDGGNVGTQANLVKKCGVASHAFAHDGRVYVWAAFAAQANAAGGASPTTFKAQLQNSYFLYRDDGRLVSRAVFQRGGGFAPTRGVLPGVQRISDNRYRWLGLERRLIELSAPEDNTPSTGYAARGPVDITIDFDTNVARRVAQIGETLYVAGGQVLQFDGQSFVELGYHTAPWYFDMLELGSGSPAIPSGSVHTFYLTFAWENAKGELDRSTSQVTGQGTTTATARWQIDPKPLSVTRKTSPRNEAAIEAWRTQTAPTPDAPAYLITSKDPSDTGDNGFEENDPTAASQTITDNFTDATLATKELYPESGAVLASIAPPSASIIYASDERVFLAGIAENPYRLAYSKIRSAGSVAAFNDALFIDLPRFGGPITAIAEVYGVLVVFQETAVHQLPGSGFDNVGGGSNYGPPQLVASDVGAESQEAVVLTPEGLVFKSKKGWYVFDRGFTVRYIGGDVDAFDDETVLASHVLEDQHELRVLTSERCLVYDFVAKQWAHWTLMDGVSAVLWQGQYVYATDDAILIEDQTQETPSYFSMVVETAWIKLNGLQGFGRCRHASIIGRYLSGHSLKVEVGRDGSDEYFQSKVWTPPDTQPYQLRHALSIQKLQSVRFRFTDLDIDGESLPPGQSLSLSGLALEVGLKRGFRPRPATKLQ